MAPQSPDWSDYARGRNLSRSSLLFSRHVEGIDALLRFFATLPPGARILDIGPASGLPMTLLRELGFPSVKGLEVSPLYVEGLRRKNLDVQLGDIVSGEGLDALEPPYDVVTLIEVLEHLADPARALSHIRRLLGPDGILYLSVPTCDCVFDRLRRLLRGATRREQVLALDETHLHAFCAADLRALLSQAGFDRIRIRRVSFEPPSFPPYYPGARWFLLLRALLPDFLRGQRLCLTARVSPGKEPK